MIAGLVGLLGCGQEPQEQKEKVAVAANIHYTKESEIPGAYMRQPAAENPEREIAILDLGGHPAAAYRCPHVYIIQHDATLIDNSRHSGEYSTFVDITPVNLHGYHCHDIEARISPDGLQAAVAVIHRRTSDDIARGFHPEEPAVAFTSDNTTVDYYKINSCNGDYSKSKPYSKDHSMADERYTKQGTKEQITVDSVLDTNNFSFVQLPEDPLHEHRLRYQVWTNCDFFPAKSKGNCMNDSPRPEGVRLEAVESRGRSVITVYAPIQDGCR